MPFGLCNAPAIFQRLMDLLLAGVQWSKCLVYLDETIVLGKNFDDHLHNLGTVLGKLREAGLKLKPSKCALLQKSVLYLSHIVSREGIATDPENRKGILLANTNLSKRNTAISWAGNLLSQIRQKFCENFQTTIQSN